MKPALRNLILCLAGCALFLGFGLVRAVHKHADYNTPADFSEEKIENAVIEPSSEGLKLRDNYYVCAPSADDLVSRSDCVLRVRAEPGQKFMHYYFLTPVEVVETLYGSSPSENRIYICESTLFVQGHPLEKQEFARMFLNGVQNKLLEGREYVIALKKLEFAKGSFSPEHDGRVYILTDQVCSVFPYGHEPECLVYNLRDMSSENKNPVIHHYRDVKEIDYIGRKSLLDAAMKLYDSMVDKFGKEAFGLSEDQQGGGHGYIPTLPPESMPEEGTVEWLAAMIDRIRFEGQMLLEKPDLTEIMDFNDDTELLNASTELEMHVAYENAMVERLLGVSIGSSEITKVVSENADEITADVLVKVSLGYEDRIETLDDVFRITVDKERMIITAYDRPEGDGSLYSERLKPLALSYAEELPWKDAIDKAFFELFNELYTNGKL